MVSALVYLLWLGFGTISFIILILMFFFFGRLMKLQFKIWLLAKKGYHQVRHIGLNKIETYYYLRPRDKKFDFNDGFYLHAPETVTKSDSLLASIPKTLKLNRLDKDGVDDDEYKKLYNTVNKLVYDMDAVTLRWGIPTITYVGNDPNPVKFGEHEKIYGAQLIKDIYIRLLATQQYKKLMQIITILMLVGAGLLVVLGLLYTGYRGTSKNLANCLSMLNSTHKQLVDLTNSTARMLAQNSTIII